MRSHTASPEVTLPPGFAAGTVMLEASIVAAKGGEAPAWIKIAPRGAITTRDKRHFVFDPEKLAARFAEDGIEIAIDLDHSTVSPHREPKTVGWIKRFEARVDGLYGEADWLEEGRAAIRRRSHRYVSPTIHADDDGSVTWIHSVALVSAPALSMPALASAGAPHTPTERSMKSIATALGLQPDASETACLNALTPILARPADGVAKAVHEETLAKLQATTSELATIKAESRKAKVEQLLEEAVKAKKIVPAQREHYAALCATDDGLANVQKLFAAQTPVLGASGLDQRQQPTDGASRAVDPHALAAAAREYADKEAKEGRMVSMAAAVEHVRTKLEAA